MKQRIYILLLIVWASVCAYAQVPVRYVRTAEKGGAYNNNGHDWNHAKDKVQDAINELRDYMQTNNLDSGEVYIAAGNYVPTESTEAAGGSMLNTSFKIYAGIHVYGGFNPDTPEEKPGDRIMANGKKCSENWADQSGIGTVSGTEIASQWDFQYKTILSGNHTSTPPTFVFDSIRGKYNTAFPASSFHVVWFATNGKYTEGVNDSTAGHYKPLTKPASLDGCVISSGAASSRNTQVREHTAYGGGVYMVGNARLRGCIIERCIATMRGGGIYADGGGDIDFCLVQTCQVTGVGVLEGYGGGVCIDYGGSIGHSHIAGCAARCGGGLLISHIPGEYPTTGVPAIDTLSNYSPFATACVINNNTANAEGGGIYLAEGGTVNHCTVTANNCMGPDVTYYGRRHGRTGGIYVRNCGMIFNSVFWGNRCDVNNDIQFASVRQKTDSTYETLCYHTAFMNHDITDWTGVRKEQVYALEKQNLPVNHTLGNHPCFFHPTADPTDWDRYEPSNGIYGAGVFQHLYPVQYPGPRVWHLTSYSALDQKGVQANETVKDVSPWLLHAHTDYGVVSNPYEPMATLGALVRRPDPLTYALIAPQGYEGRVGGDPIPTLFIDPDRTGVFDSVGNFVPQSQEGNSWTAPIKDFGEALSFFRQYLVDDEGGNHHYMIPALDGDGMATGDPVRYDYVQFLVKEGTLRTVGHGNYLDKNIRTAAIRLESHMRMYGGYSKDLTGTETSGRNPRKYKSSISANITGAEGASGYQNNSAHVIAMVNVENSIVDGFTLSDANTHDVYLSASAQAGGGVLVNNASTPAEKRIDMVGNQLRNCVIANCSSPKGAAVYVNGEFPKSDGELCYAELMMQNCVIRNNTADYKLTPSVQEHGIITANGRAYVHIEHCTVATNVGYVFKADSKTTDTDQPIVCPHPEHDHTSIYHGYIRVDNSLIFCNGDRVLDNRGDLDSVAQVMSVNSDGQDYVFGKWNMFDADLRLHKLNVHEPRGFFANDFDVPITEHFLPDGVVSHFTHDISDVPADSASRANRCIFTRVSTEPNYPTFVNPSRNVGHSTTGDKPLYGGVVAYDPLTTNPCVNAAHPDDYTEIDNYDRSDNLLRNRGGAPDVGAVENSDLPAAGSVIYVTQDGAGKRDGSSWDNAIAGNTVYRLYNAPAADGDSVDIASGARLINQSTGDPVLTTDPRYCGGFSMRKLYPIFTDRGRNISRDLEIETYTGGNNPRVDTIALDTTSNKVISAIKYNNAPLPADFVSEKGPDPRYPYGEMSGASRYTYRAADNLSPYDEKASNVMLDGSVSTSAPTVVNSGRLVLRNERKENYVSGLQYAVEQASMLNKKMHEDSVQVWVGAGKYTDYKGFVMRDSVTVLGGFPAGKFQAPALSERRALMSKVVTIPKSKENKDLDPVDYESILQISDVNPQSGTGASAVINPDAIKFYDDSATVKVNINNVITQLSDHKTIRYYHWVDEPTDINRTNDYLLYPAFKDGSNNAISSYFNSDATDEDGIRSFQIGTPPTDTKDCWHVSFPDKTNNIGFNPSNLSTIYHEQTYTITTSEGESVSDQSGVWIWLRDGSLTNTSVWQTIKQLPAGTYSLQVDLGGGYRNAWNDKTSNTNIDFYILDADENVLSSQHVPNIGARGIAVRYNLSFTLETQGDVTLKLFVGAGTRGTGPGGADPETIPASGSNPNRREIWMSNLKLFEEVSGQYVLDSTVVKNTTEKQISSTNISEEYIERGKHRTTLRKHVLRMPDVTSTVYAHGLGDPAANNRGKCGDNLAHYERVIKEGRLSNVKATGGTINGRHQDPNYKEYNEANWDGFTIRHGFITNQHMTHGGGAGVSMFEGGHLLNCIVTDNFVGCRGAKGGGVFCDGSTSTIENCFILNNTLTQGTYSEQSQQQGAGLFLYEGTCFNSLMGNNFANGPGAGVAVCVGKFYNNTLAYNTSNNNVGGLRICTGSEPALFMANTVVFGNNGLAIDITDGKAAVAPFINCYIQSASKITKTNFLNAIYEHSEGVTDGYFGRNNTFLNQKNPTKDNTPFAADIDENGNYTGNAKTYNDFALRQATGIKCVNSGEDDFEGAMYAGVRAYLQREDASKNPSDDDIKKETFYKNVVGVELPANDVVYAKRVQDCQVDIGAYEFNAAYSIRPDTTTHPGKAIFYVAYESQGGDASASSPSNAACAQKLQLVLDAAGRYKYNLMTAARYNKGEAGSYTKNDPNKHWTVEVWLEGDSIDANASNDYHAFYTPTRSTKHHLPGYHDNTLDYSFIIPHGIQVKGGYKSGYFHYVKDGAVVLDSTGAQLVDDRDPLTYRTVLSGKITSSTGAKGNTFHVVTFTNDLFDPDENLYTNPVGGEQIHDQLTVLTHEKDRVVVDGLFIEDGYANSPDPEDQIGAGAVVTEYAHVRNCVIMNNKSLEKGGGLYLKPFALVSGTIIKSNSAKVGGGVYIEAPASHNVDSLARVFSTTICENEATSSAGGMFFQDSYARVNSTVIWHNMASDNANVSGTFSRSDVNTDYPLNFCAVESRRLEGQGNLELSPTETEGVRWDRTDPFNAILYYPIEMSSTLSRAGMTYNEWRKAIDKYPTLDTVDIAGVHRAKWTSDGSKRGFFWGTDTLVTKNNDMIEIGARAINKTFAINVDKQYVMRRLYVMHTDLIDSKAARKLQDNTKTDSISQMYRQMGSSILNPFHRPGDAFDYIIAARKSDPARYCNTVFEVFIEQGTYYPYHNAYGDQDEVRNNTFLIPEGIYVIGGVDSRPADHKYGQYGYYDKFTDDSISAGGATTVEIPGTGYSINVASMDSIRQRGRHRPMRDNNLNSVIEPWELERQTIFSGNAVSGESFTHVYHVITMHADSTKVGPQPRMFKAVNPAYLTGESKKMFLLKDTICRTDTANFHKECDLSILGRTVEFDGIQITGGYANHLDAKDTLAHHYVKKTYFRGGGIFVDGLWTDKLSDASLPNMTEPAHYNIPIVVENCVFTDNMAGNGGAIYSNGGIYAYGNHFTQNYSQGPMTPLDQKFIPWTAGGCIATNAVCDVSNTLFDNNEARRGLYPINVKGADSIPDADARQGFGGVLSVAAQSHMRVVNCHFMKNKAVAYSSIYNFLANNRYSTADSMQIAINTIFWGNEVFTLPNNKLSDLEYKVAPPAESESAFATKYRGSRAGVFHYDPSQWENYERLYTEYTNLYNEYAAAGDTFNIAVTDKLAELRAVGDAIEGLYFCSYRPGYGPTGMKPTKEGFLLTKAEQRAFKDPRSINVKIKLDSQNDRVEDLDNLFSYVHGNNNTLINPINTATDGPNFRQPSFIAGIDGYMQNADWLLARMNLTTDQGWGHLTQSVARGIGYYITKYTGKQRFSTPEEALEAAKAIKSSATMADVYPISGMPAATFDPPASQPSPGAIYNFYSKRFGTFMSSVNAPLPLGDQQYMTYTLTTSNSETAGVMERISRNPRMGEKDVYIDVGVYEYQYVTLDIEGQEIDTMWVSTKEKGSKHDGLTWETPTTDLQMAIDMLMSSHNNHDKYICFLGDKEGSISPSTVLDNRLAFVITSKSQQPLLPDSAMADYDYGVKSLNFLGGYSYDVKDAPRDPVSNPVVIEMPDGNRSQRNQLFVVEDMTRQMLQVNFTGEHTARDSVVIPITFDGITFCNPYAEKDRRSDALDFGGLISRRGGAAIYYRWQRRYEGVSETNVEPIMDHALHPDSALIDGKKVTLPKLTISNCIFMDNGSRASDVDSVRSPAVRIDHGGGSSLIVNSLFHSNAGNPVFAQTYPVPDVRPEGFDLDRVPNDVTIMNSTFALNDGHIVLRSDSSQVHNSILWLNDLMNDTTIQLRMGDDQWDKTTNREKPGIEHRMTYNAVWGCFMQKAKDTYHNDSLVTDNKDIFGGPGFLNPYVTATTSEQRRERNFRLNPSAMTMDRANDSTYRKHVFFRVYPDTCTETHDKYWRRANGFKSTYITSLVNDSDLACKPRLSGRGMERGAYECLVELQRVLYVIPSKTSSGDGSNWANSFGRGELQNAIDAAAVYTYLKQAENREGRKAYVFVKSSPEDAELERIVARDGVSVIGSIPSQFLDTAVADEGKVFTNAECQRFTNYVRAYVPGVASPNAIPTRISSIHVISDKFNTGFLLEGFMITNPGLELHASPVILNNDSVTLRNCLITENTVLGVPLADVKDGLLYNNLFYGNTADTIVKVGARGLALNNTIVTAEGSIALDSTNAAYRIGAAQNNIAINRTPYTVHTTLPFAPYMTAANSYNLPEYLRDNPSLAYQLHENSDSIDAGVAEENLPALFNNCRTDKTIDFAHDRDILGNPRKIGSAVDMGALETWFVAPKQTEEITALTDRRPHTATEEEQRTAYLRNYGGNFYPHAGSVVYIMDSAAMSMQYKDATEDFLNFENNSFALRPGFMLLKSGASLYGNGHRVQLRYIAAEKRFKNQRYSMTSFPFNYSKENITPAIEFNTYQYAGAARSAKDYVFQPTNSSSWLSVDTLNRTATDGYLMDFGAVTDTVLRFNAFAPNSGEYIYTEDGNDKTISLTQYDHRTGGTGADLNFTTQENMGWNMKGLPWLVSYYRTDTLLDVSNYYRQMYIPHVIYQMDGSACGIAGDQAYTSQSWYKGTTVAMGNAFLTQTATQNEKETIIFHQPYYDRNKKIARPVVVTSATPVVTHTPARGASGPTQSLTAVADMLTLIPDSTSFDRVQYAYGRDGIKWTANENLPQMYAMDSKRLSRISLLGAAPVEVDIPVGLHVPDSYNGYNFTFSLPDKEPYEPYPYVWLIDYEAKTFVNLQDEDYTLPLEAGEYTKRFAIRIGGFKKNRPAATETSYVIFASGGTLYVRGTQVGDRITVYTTAGQLVATGIAEGDEWTMLLPLQTGYIVRVNDTAQKVLNR